MGLFSSAMLSCFDNCCTGVTFCEVLALELLKCFDIFSGHRRQSFLLEELIVLGINTSNLLGVGDRHVLIASWLEGRCYQLSRRDLGCYAGS
jgi:hypothetical protein